MLYLCVRRTEAELRLKKEGHLLHRQSDVRALRATGAARLRRATRHYDGAQPRRQPVRHARRRRNPSGVLQPVARRHLEAGSGSLDLGSETKTSRKGSTSNSRRTSQAAAAGARLAAAVDESSTTSVSGSGRGTSPPSSPQAPTPYAENYNRTRTGLQELERGGRDAAGVQEVRSNERSRQNAGGEMRRSSVGEKGAVERRSSVHACSATRAALVFQMYGSPLERRPPADQSFHGVDGGGRLRQPATLRVSASGRAVQVPHHRS
jgi:hypothetical protein